MSILVVAEARGDRLTAPSIEAVAAAQQLAEPISLLVPGDNPEAASREAAVLDVAEVVAFAHPSLATYTADGYTASLRAYITETTPAWVFFPHTYQSRDYVPALAASLERSLITDCIALHRSPEDLTFLRPAFRGKVNAEMAFDGTPPCLVTVQVGAFRADTARRREGAAPVRPVAAALDPVVIRQRAEPPFREAKQAVDLTQADRIVAVGRGIKDRDHLAVAESLAAALGAELAASRPICDAGWLPMDRQVGSSGQTVAPRLYVALGISGAIQHIVGMKGARTIVAINKDPEAPIFEVADYGIVGDLFDVVPEMIAALKD